MQNEKLQIKTPSTLSVPKNVFVQRNLFSNSFDQSLYITRWIYKIRFPLFLAIWIKSLQRKTSSTFLFSVFEYFPFIQHSSEIPIFNFEELRSSHTWIVIVSTLSRAKVWLTSRFPFVFHLKLPQRLYFQSYDSIPR